MNQKLRKITAILLMIVFAAAVAAGCAPQKAEAGIDLEAQRAEFAQASQNRLVEQTDGVTPQTTLETDGPLLVSVDYPVVEKNTTVSSELQSYAENEIGKFRTEAEGMGTPDETTGLFALTLTYKPYPVGTELLGVKFTESSYTGKTDNKNYIDAFVYDLATGSRLGLSDVFDATQEGYLNLISETVRQYLLENEIVRKNMKEDLFQNGTAASVQNFSNFVLTPDNQIVFFFNKNTVAPGEAGTLEVCVPLSEFESILNPQNKEILYGKVVERPATASPAPEDGTQPVDGTQPADGTAQPVDLSQYPQFNKGEEFLPMMSLDGIDPVNDKVVCITFDDGPTPSTPRLLDGLAQYGVKATFFVVGDRVADYADTLKRTYDEGHEIATHSWDHSNLTKLSVDEILNNQFGKANDAIEAVIGKRALFDRPPGGAMTEELAAQIGREQIMWSVDSEDWKNKKPDGDQALMDKTYNNIMNTVKDGSIILMHDLYPNSVDVALRVIPELQEQGYKFVTVSQMIQIAAARGDKINYMFGANPAGQNGSGAEPADTPTYGDDTADAGDNG